MFPAMPLPLPQLERVRGRPLTDQIERHFRAAIEQGRFRAGDRLPTIRAAAGQLRVTRATVQEAYKRLAESGLVSGTVGRGTVVTPAAVATGDSVFSAGAHAAWQHLRTAARAPSLPAGAQLEVTFADLLPDQGHFPVEAFAESLGRVLRDRGSDLLEYGDPLGNPELRRQLAAREDAACAPEEILITSGGQQGIDLVLRTFTAPGDAVAVPVPTYHHMYGLLRAYGLELVPIAQGEDGIDSDEMARALARPGVRLLYLMPTFHNPTGRTLDGEARRTLAAVVARTRVPVLEDEFQRELRFAGDPLPTLRELDERGLTITVRTFSKGLFPGVRTGWVRAAPEVLGRMVALKRFTDLETSPLLQAALADFTARGALDRHLEQMRAALRQRHAVAQRALERHMPPRCAWSRPEGGFALWLETQGDGERLAQAAAARGVLVTPGRAFNPDAAPSPGVRLSLSRAEPPQVESGIAVLGACAREQQHAASSERRIFF